MVSVSSSCRLPSLQTLPWRYCTRFRAHAMSSLIATATIMIYDHILSLHREYELIWVILM
ncbi:hypothetical protein CPB85DRAFT_1308764 [Mucidula mucida]|nr:hypothetical protein CPB85DRAFT_1308764 [Mucidula mucida]